MSALTLSLIVLVVGAILVAGFMWMMLTEWSYVGTGLVRRSYDWLAPWYERKWRSTEYQSRDLNQRLFVAPLTEATGGRPDARVLDLACGTGRVSCLLLDQDSFAGQIEAIDFSARMLDRFREHLATRDLSRRERVSLQQLDLTQWEPARPAMYDAVVLMEAAELIPDLPRLIAKICMALKPGGTLVTTQVGRKFVWLFRGRHQQDHAMTQLLADSGLEEIRIQPWRERYDVVLARKPGEEAVVG